MLLVLQWRQEGSAPLQRKFTQCSVSQESLATSTDCSEGLTHHADILLQIAKCKNTQNMCLYVSSGKVYLQYLWLIGKFESMTQLVSSAPCFIHQMFQLSARFVFMLTLYTVHRSLIIILLINHNTQLLYFSRYLKKTHIYSLSI